MKPQIAFASPDDCSRAFYEAFSRRDLEALMSTFAEDEEVCCVHPGAAPLYGYTAVRAAWEAIFRNNANMRIELRDERWNTTVGMVVQWAIEWIYVGEEQDPRGPVFATNIFLRSPLGWRLISHTASPVQTGFAPGAAQVVLH